MKKKWGLLSWVTFKTHSAPQFHGCLHEGGRGLCGESKTCTLNSPCCYPSLVHLEGREEEVSSKSGIFQPSEGSPPSSEQTPDTSVMQLKYVSWHERLIQPCWAVLDLSLQRKLSSLGKMSDMIKPLGCWHFTGLVSHLYLCVVGGKVRGNYNVA